MTKRKSAFEKLLAMRSWSLQRVSPATFPGDVIATHYRRGGGDRLTKRESAAIVDLVKRGTAYRCRIGKGRYYYGSTQAAAIEAALARYAQPRKGTK